MNDMEIKQVDLFYPRDRHAAIRIDLVDVRAADGILVEYDFKRDGWKISQNDGTFNENLDEWNWKEVAFLAAWSLYEDE